MKELEVTGIWWSPASPEIRSTGTLKFTPKSGLELQLVGGWELLSDRKTMGGDDHPILVGAVQGAKEVTLRNCHAGKTSSNVMGVVSQTYRAQFGLVGAAIEEIERHTFRKAYLEFSQLPSWVSFSGFSHSHSDHDGEYRTLTVTFTTPEALTAPIEDGTVTLSIGYQMESTSFHDVALKQTHHITVEVGSDLTIGQWLGQYIGCLNDLMTLLVGTPSAVTGVTLMSPHIVREYSENATYQVPVELLYQPVFAEAGPTAPRLIGQVLVPLPQIRDRFAAIVPRWLNVVKDLHHPLSLFFGVQYRSNIYQEQRFIAVAQSLETYHRLRRTKNTPRLRDRVKELAAEAIPVLRPLIRDPDRFAERVADTRNYYTHYDDRLRSKAARGAELFHLTQAMSYLFVTCLLVEIGITLDECAELFDDYSEYIWAVNSVGK